MNAPFAYLREQFDGSDQVLETIRDLVDRGDYTLGVQVEAFERQFAELCQTRFAVGVGSGTDALFLILKALGVGPGDEVVTVPNTFVATVGAIAATGAKPVFVDVNEQFLIDTDRLSSAITDRTKAVLPVHLAGQPVDIDAIKSIVDERGIPVVEDACQAAGASINGRPAGSLGVAAGFSLHPQKNLNVWGDGGVITTDSEAVDAKLRLLRNHGLANREVVECFGYNSRLDTIQAIVGSWLLPQLAEINDIRRKIAEAYDDGLRDVVTIPPRIPGVLSAYHLYFALVEGRDDLVAHLQENEIDTRVHYPIPVHLQQAAEHLGYGEGDFPVCESQCRNVISLPNHQHLADEQVAYVIETVRAFYGD